jgi:hypothetical protein
MKFHQRLLPAVRGKLSRQILDFHPAATCNASRTVERLEPRTLLTVALDSAGWTQVTPSADSRMIYVSSSAGSDTNTGLSPDAPVATIAKAYSLLRDGDPDWLLFKRGDTFNGAFTYFDDSGRSPQEPMVVTDYGDPTLARPVIDSGADTAFRTGTANHDLYVIGLDFTSSTHNPTSPNFTGKGSYGFYDLGGTSDLLIEDCQFSYFVNDITFQGYNGPLSDVTIRRDEILDAYNVGGHSEGLYADSITNLTIEDNIFDHDGWTTLVPGGGATIYNHDCYLHSSNVNCVVTGNTFADAASFGLEARAGGIVDNNLFVGDPYGFAFGLVNGSTVKAGGVAGEAIGNVVIDPRADATGWGIGALIGNLAPGGNTLIADNIFADAPGDTAPAMSFAPGNAVSNPKQEAGLHSVTISDNTSYGWGFGISMSSKYVDGGSGAGSLSDVTITDNNFQNNDTPRIVSHDNPFSAAYETWSGNTYNDSADPFQWFNLQGVRTSLTSWQNNVEPTSSSTPVTFIDSDATVDTYMMSLGQTGGLSAYIADVRDMSSSNWSPFYLATAVSSYIQEGFTVGTPDPTLKTRTVAIPPVGPQVPAAAATPPAASAPMLGPTKPTVSSTGSTVDPTASPAPSAPPTQQVPTGSSAPALSRIVLNYANSKHTAVNSIQLVFSQQITSSAAMVSVVANAPAGDSTVTTFVSNPSGDGTNWLVTFFGQPSLPAGAYTLTIHGAAIINPPGQAMAADQVTTFEVPDEPLKVNRLLPKNVVVKISGAVKPIKPARVVHPMRLTASIHHAS